VTENKLHTAVMEAVSLLNGVHMGDDKTGGIFSAHNILRKALIDYADEALQISDQPAGHEMVVMLYETGAPNYYVERIVTDHDPREVEVIARYIDGETPVEQLAVAKAKLDNYEKTLGRIAEGHAAPMLLARAVLSGANWDVK